jgi:hypothetical protein
MNKTHLFILLAFLGGVVLADKVRTLPVLSKLPTV